MMKLQQQGAYMRLICFCWDGGCELTNDPKTLYRLSGLAAENAPQSDLDEVIRVGFVPHPDRAEKLTNAKLLGLWNVAMDGQARRRAAGEAGAAARWQSHSDRIGAASHGNAIASSTSTCTSTKTGSGSKPWKCLKGLNAATLEDPAKIEALLHAAVEEGVWGPNESDRVRWFSLAARAIREANNPPGMFRTLLVRLPDQLTGQDEDQGEALMRGKVTRRKPKASYNPGA